MIGLIFALVARIASFTVEVDPGYTYHDAHGHTIVIEDTTIVTFK